MKLKESTKTEIVRWSLIAILVLYFNVVVQSFAQEIQETKTKEEAYFTNKMIKESKTDCIMTKEIEKDKTSDSKTKYRVFEVNCNGNTWKVSVAKEKLK